MQKEPHSITNVSSVSVDEQSCGIPLSSFTVTILKSPCSEQADSLDSWSSLSYLQIQPTFLIRMCFGGVCFFFLMGSFSSILSKLLDI